MIRKDGSHVKSFHLAVPNNRSLNVGEYIQLFSNVYNCLLNCYLKVTDFQQTRFYIQKILVTWHS